MQTEQTQKNVDEKKENWRKQMEETKEVLRQVTARALQNDEEIKKLKEELAKKEQQIRIQNPLAPTQGTPTSFAIP